MPRLRSEQLQSLTLTDLQISDGFKYDATGSQIDGFDPNRLIDQSKIRGIQYQPNGWISRGIINKVEVLPEWVADYEGRLFYVNASDQLFLGVGTDPWYVLISGNSGSGWDAELTVRTGLDGLNWNGSIATQFTTISYNFSPDGSDLFVYLNGSLMRKEHDYELVDQKTIRMLRNIEQNDTVTLLVILSNSLLNYATKAWVFDQIQSGGLQHSLDAAYNDGSIISVNNRDVDWRLNTDNKFIVSQASTSIALPAVYIGDKILTSGHNWQSRWQSFDITVRNGGNIIGPRKVILNSPCVTANEAATEVSESLVTAGITDLFGYTDGGKIGIQSSSVGSDISFTISSTSNALPVFNITEQIVQGDDAYSSYHNFGLNVNAQNTTNLRNTEKFWFKVNGVDHFISTGINTTYNQLRGLIDAELLDFDVTTEGDVPNQDIRITNKLPGLAYQTLVEPLFYAGQIEITQITANADINRNLSSKYFELNAIDSALFGKSKPYYVWFHLDAEPEISQISFTSENSNVTLADKYFTLYSPSNNYFVWFEVETPQTAGYQELGLIGITETTNSGLIQDTPYYFKISKDGNSFEEFSITTSPDIQPTEEITKVTTTNDISQSLSGKYWTLNSKTGTGYYIWYNIDTPAAPEITQITTLQDESRSLSSKKFKLFSPTQEYYAWFSMMLDPGMPLLPEITEVIISGDVSQSLSGKYFNIDSANGSRHYVWYEMMTDPGVVAKTEITEINTIANTGNILSSKYFNISTTGTDYYVWYRTQIAEPISGAAEVTEIIISSDNNKSLSGKYWTFNTPYNNYYVWYRMEEVASQPATAQETTITFGSQVPSNYNYDTTEHSVRIYNFEQAYDIVWTTTGTANTSLLSNPIIVNISSATTAADIAALTSAAIGSLLQFNTTNSGDNTIVTNSNVGQQSNNPSKNGSYITVSVTNTGSDYVPGVFSTNPAPAGKTGIQINITENDSNTVVASLTNSQLSLLSDITTEINSAVITITNNDNGSVVNAADFDAGIVPNVLIEGVTSQPAQYSSDPSIPNRVGIVVNINHNDDDDSVANYTYNILNAMPQFNATINNNKITIETTLAGSVSNSSSGDSGFTIITIQEGVNYVAPTYSSNPAPGGRSGIKVVIAENDGPISVAEATRIALDSNINFTATKTNEILKITDATPGPVDAAYDVNTLFAISTYQDGQDYIAPTYSTNPGGAGIGIKIDIEENATDIIVAQAIESTLSNTNFSATRSGNIVTVTNIQPGVANNSIDIDTGFTIITTQDGYEAYSSVNPLIPMRTGIKVNIIENDNAEAVAVKTSILVNNIHFTASTSGNEIIITDKNGGEVLDAEKGTTIFDIDVVNQGTNLIPADVSWEQILILLNAFTPGVDWSIVGGDIRVTSNTLGSKSSISMSSGTTGTDLFNNITGFVNLESHIIGTSTYSAIPSVAGTPIKVEVLRNSGANTVAQLAYNAINNIPDFSAEINTNIVTITNVATNAVNDIQDFGTNFEFNIINQGANESINPNIAGKTGIRVDINKNDIANNVALKMASAIDVGGEFYVTRLNNVISVQNDFPGEVNITVDVNTGFAITKTGHGEDVKYSLFGFNGLNITLPAFTAGINAVPAIIPVGITALTGGFNFYTFPKDFAVIVNNEPISEVFLDQACYNSSAVVSHINDKILAAGMNNLEAYQDSGRIGFRTIQTGLNQTINLKNSLSDALITLGWVAGTFTGDFGEADSIFKVEALAGQNEITINADILPVMHGVNSIGSFDNKFKDLYVKEIYVDTSTIHFGTDNEGYGINIGPRKLKDDGVTEFISPRVWEDGDFRFTRSDGKDFFLTAGNNEKNPDNPNEYIVRAQESNSGASKVGVRGLIGIIPKYDIDGNLNELNQTGWDSDLQTMMEALALQAGGSCKNFDNFNVWRTEKTGVDIITGEGDANARGFFKNRTQLYVRDLEREIRILKYESKDDPINGETPVGPGFVGPGQWNSGEAYSNWDWDWLWGRNRPMRGEDFHIVLNKLDQYGVPTSGSLESDSILLKTTGGIKLETGNSSEVQITNDLRVMGDLIVDGDSVSLNVSELKVEDNIITLNKNWTGAPVMNAGVEIERGSSVDAKLIWDEQNDIWRAGLEASEQAIAMRSDSQTNNGVTIWNDSTKTYNTTSALIFNGTDMNFNTSGSKIISVGGTGSKIDGFEKIYNAVWNDLAEMVEIDNGCEIEYGKCYYITPEFKHRKTTEIAQKGVFGIASDTYGIALGKKEGKNQMPIAVSGFVLAHIDGIVEAGDALTCNQFGNLVVMSDEMKSKYPERIIAVYYKPELLENWNGIMVNGRHWVKVK